MTTIPSLAVGRRVVDVAVELSISGERSGHGVVMVCLTSCSPVLVVQLDGQSTWQSMTGLDVLAVNDSPMGVPVGGS